MAAMFINANSALFIEIYNLSPQRDNVTFDSTEKADLIVKNTWRK